jgi:hypothetical protein
VINRRRYKRCKEILASLRDAIKKRTEQSLTASLEMCGELPFTGTHLAVVTEAKHLQIRVKEENKVIKLLENAIKSKEINALKSAIEACASMKPAFEHPLLAQARDLTAKVEAENKVRAELLAAVGSRNVKQLGDAIAKANGIKLQCNELQQVSHGINMTFLSLVLITAHFR